MLSAFAHALEAILGGALAPAAMALRVLATLALVAGIVLAGRSIALAVEAWRYGWIAATIVCCPACGRLAADPSNPLCPEGHEVRFPPSRFRWIASRQAGRGRLVRAAYPVVLAAVLATAALGAYLFADLDILVRPISTITASLAYLFFAAALCAFAFTFSARPYGLLVRTLHAGLALALLVPALVLFLLARGFEPPVEREIGYLWTTPAALYVRSGGRARREGPAGGRLDAFMIEAQVPGIGVVWEGLEGFRGNGKELPWRGSGGWTARLIARWLRPSDSHPGFFRRSVQTLRLEPNHRVRILAARDHVRFLAER